MLTLFLLLQVFEDDWVLTRPTDSGCPSDSVHEDGVFEKCPASVRLRGEDDLRVLKLLDGRREGLRCFCLLQIPDGP